MLFLCIRPLVDKFLAVLVQADAPLDQLLDLQGDGLGEEVWGYHVGLMLYKYNVITLIWIVASRMGIRESENGG